MSEASVNAAVFQPEMSRLNADAFCTSTQTYSVYNITGGVSACS